MGWSLFPYFAVPYMILWICGAAAAWKGWCKAALSLTLAGLVICLSFILGIWIAGGVPPLRTMGHTRLWYAFFMPLIGSIVYVRWRYKWILSFSTMMAVMFTCINLFKTEIHTQALMPALQSPWFAPHVIVYMFSYALLGAATIMAVYILLRKGRANAKGLQDAMEVKDAMDSTDGKEAMDSMSIISRTDRIDNINSTDSINSNDRIDSINSTDRIDNINSTDSTDRKEAMSVIDWKDVKTCDDLVMAGLSFLTFGMLFGALWAKQAWGISWAWDPKETWAAVTWFTYLYYIHLRISSPKDIRKAMWVLIFAFCCLQMCWWGISYLPAAQGRSVHTYGN